MVSLRSFIDRSNLQGQLQDVIDQLLKEGEDIHSPDVRSAITSCIQASLENYICEVYLQDSKNEAPESIQETIEAITYHLSPESKSEILENCSDDEAYRLGRAFHSLSKRMLPC